MTRWSMREARDRWDRKNYIHFQNAQTESAGYNTVEEAAVALYV